jgi:hypothetical protein
MPSLSPQFSAAIEFFDAANGEDPNRTVYDGRDYPDELLYALRMTAWLDRLSPDASEPLRLAARSQHIRRWMIPRSQYPMNRAGYHQWRTSLAAFHAQQAGQILQQVGYDAATIARVQSLLRKERLQEDADAQLLEDVICLVFLESYFPEFARQHEEAKLITILRKTWRKMSPVGRSAALKLNLAPADRALIEKALAAPTPEPSNDPEEP